MRKFQIAHIHEQGQDLIIIPLEDRFALLTAEQQDDEVAILQRGATSAGLKGVVVPVWQSGGQMHFRAPQPWHPFFRSIDAAFIAANINRELTCP